MTRTRKPRKLAHEILGLIAISALTALGAFLLLTWLAMTAVEEYVFQHDILLSEFDWIELDRLMFGTGAVLAIVIFSVMFLALLARSMAYIRAISAGIDDLRNQQAQPVEELGNNELTQLARAVNDLSCHQIRVKQKETALAEEKEELIRSLSHDIRTPLTSIMTYAEYLAAHEQGLSPEGKTQMQTIGRKGQQIKELTDILLDGGKRNLEYFVDGRLLFAQLVDEFSETLEDGFDLQIDTAACSAFSGRFDVRELRRLFDNLSSNVRKYADRQQPVLLSVALADGVLLIRQSNAVCTERKTEEGFGIGLQSIRRIAQSYGGTVRTDSEKGLFSITITFHL